jgi:hypothetical protein
MQKRSEPFQITDASYNNFKKQVQKEHCWELFSNISATFKDK